MKRIEHLEVVCVSVGYGDFLAETLKWNLPHFDRLIVVTEPSDEKTRSVCNRFNVEVLLSDDGSRHTRAPSGMNKGTFNKGRMIERGLQMTSDEGWRLHIDADIALPHRFRHLLEIADLHQDWIYGCDRAMIKSWEDWQRLIKSGYMQGNGWDYHCRTAFPYGFEIGTRWVHPQMGYVPIGFFQLFHSSQDEWRGIRVKPYPSNHSTACRTDVQFGLRWDRHRRGVIPELMAVHLESEQTKKGANWNGRTTKLFGPGTDNINDWQYGGSNGEAGAKR